MTKPFTSYALLGSGRLARHLQFYLSALDLPVRVWSRRTHSEAELHTLVAESSHVLFALKDEAIAKVAQPFLQSGRQLVHFSGALRVEGVAAAHPLMTFGRELEDLDWYRLIPFVTDTGSTLADLLPGLPNRSWAIATEQRTLYHALTSLAGNASYLLWQRIGAEFERQLGLPRHILQLYLHQCVSNSGSADPRNFTGPVARGDWEVVQGHLDALKDSPELRDIYSSYLQLARHSGQPIPEDLL